MKSCLLENLHCPACAGSLALAGSPGGSQLVCLACALAVPVQAGIPLFSAPPQGIVPSEKIERGPERGTPWRRANWRFLQAQIEALPPGALVLDVGAGRGDFADLLAGRQYLALDIYPYPEVDLVCDLAQANPLVPGRFDMILLMNVLEHVLDAHALLEALAKLLKPGGALVVAVPFMVKIHQAPVDFARYTHFSLAQLGQGHGLALEFLQGYYDPVFFLEEGLGNLRWAGLAGLPASRRYLARALLGGMSWLAGGLSGLLGPGQVADPARVKSMAPIGYHLVYRKGSRNLS